MTFPDLQLAAQSLLNNAAALEQNCPTSLGVFPLPLFLLPSGNTRLRIFEPRYLSMISGSSKGGGFAIACFDKTLKTGLPTWGTRVEVIDFHSGDDGVLVVDVQGLHLVTLEDVKPRRDGLLVAQTQYKPHWAQLEKPVSKVKSQTAEQQQIDARMLSLTRVLKNIFSEHTQLTQIYPQTYFSSPQWVCARFLEILPLSLNEKEKFIKPMTLEHSQTFLYTLVLGAENNN
ncbi:LON peptidase substrate-binding domain-containing protein [Shewanella sp. SR44-3]|uniref:LON peptidase substrate-binding domain-containing protein n=1 Tax=unclassified Shewanella TaxID=196818 RepID=UPI0015F87DC3|nr:LON peptidase substrate-binding domain-containing protein [Shewanella sp. SR44-3]MBB1269321.1 hypothetical protein [Shewanella sp. SR44-3]